MSARLFQIICGWFGHVWVWIERGEETRYTGTMSYIFRRVDVEECTFCEKRRRVWRERREWR